MRNYEYVVPDKEKTYWLRKLFSSCIAPWLYCLKNLAIELSAKQPNFSGCCQNFLALLPVGKIYSPELYSQAVLGQKCSFAKLSSQAILLDIFGYIAKFFRLHSQHIAVLYFSVIWVSTQKSKYQYQRDHLVGQSTTTQQASQLANQHHNSGYCACNLWLDSQNLMSFLSLLPLYMQPNFSGKRVYCYFNSI